MSVLKLARRPGVKDHTHPDNQRTIQLDDEIQPKAYVNNEIW